MAYCNPTRVRSHKFKGKIYKIEWKEIEDETISIRGKKIKARILGLCDPPTEPDKKITLTPKQTEKELLLAALDEGIHACDFTIKNNVVDRMSTSLGEFLWKIGFRLT